MVIDLAIQLDSKKLTCQSQRSFLLEFSQPLCSCLGSEDGDLGQDTELMIGFVLILDRNKPAYLDLRVWSAMGTFFFFFT